MIIGRGVKCILLIGGPGGLSVFGPDEKAVPSSQKMHSESKWLHDKLSNFSLFYFV